MQPPKRQWTILKRIGNGEFDFNLTGTDVEFEVMDDLKGLIETLSVSISKITSSPSGQVRNFHGTVSVRGAVVSVLGRYAIQSGIGTLVEE